MRTLLLLLCCLSSLAFAAAPPRAPDGEAAAYLKRLGWTPWHPEAGGPPPTGYGTVAGTNWRAVPSRQTRFWRFGYFEYCDDPDCLFCGRAVYDDHDDRPDVKIRRGGR